MSEARPFSSRLMTSQLATTSSAPDTATSPKTWGCRRTSLSWMPPSTSVMVKAPAARGHLDVHRREVVGLDDAVEVLQGDGGDGLVGQAEPGQDRHRRLAGEALQQRQLHVGEHQRGVAVADEQRAGREGGGERLAV